MRLFIHIVTFVYSIALLHGQSFPQNSLYLTDLYNITPAYAGLERSLSVNFNYRDQWSGFDRNPQQIYMNAHLPLYLLNGGVGVAVHSDKIGAISKSSFRVSYNYISKQSFGLISGGLSLGYTNLGLNGEQLITPEGIYEPNFISHQDPRLFEDMRSQGGFYYQAGAFLGNDRIDLGISFSNILLPPSQVSGIKVENQEVLQLFARVPYYIGENILLPSLLIKSNFQTTQTDLSCIIKNGNVFGGCSIRGYNSRSVDALVLLLGFKVNSNYTISYAYDVGISAIRQVSQGTHEIGFNYNLNKLIGIGLLPEIIYNPRNL